MKRGLLLLLVFLVSACMRGAGQDAPPAQYFFTFAEALISNPDEPARAAHRLFSAPDMDVLCARRPRVEFLSVQPQSLRVPIARSIPLHDIRVRALDASGQPVSTVALAWTMRHEAPPVLDVDALPDGATVVVALRAGRTEIKLATLCGHDVSTAATVVLTVH